MDTNYNLDTLCTDCGDNHTAAELDAAGGCPKAVDCAYTFDRDPWTWQHRLCVRIRSTDVAVVSHYKVALARLAHDSMMADMFATAEAG